MEDLTITGMVLKSIKYKEKDMLIHIFSLELGNITAIMRGVSSAKSKLKFATQPFCFAKFDITQSHDFYIVKSVELIDSFFDITSDYDNYVYASSMLEVCDYILKPNIIAESLFLNLLKTIQNILYKDIDVSVAIIKFYLELLQNLGYALNFNRCDNCGMKFVGDIKFNYETGTFRCSSCSGGSRVEARDFTILKIITATEIDRLNTIKLNPAFCKVPLKIILKNLQDRINYRIKSFDVEKLI